MLGSSASPLRRVSLGSSPTPRLPEGTTWIWSRTAPRSYQFPAPPAHGCIVVRRITDDRGRGWRVRQLWSENCHGLLFQCEVRGIRSEVRPMRRPLESLTDEELIMALAPTDD